MSEILKVLQETIAITKKTNRQLDLMEHLEAVRTKPGILELKSGAIFNTIYSNGSTVTIASYPILGSRTPNHCHDGIVEYLICTKGSVSLTFEGGYRILRVKDCASVPESCMHSVTALDDNSELIAVCVPAEPTYTDSMKCK